MEADNEIVLRAWYVVDDVVEKDDGWYRVRFVPVMPPEGTAICYELEPEFVPELGTRWCMRFELDDQSK